MNTLRNLFIVLFLALGVTPVQAAEPAHDHSHGAPAAAATPNEARDDDAAVMARMHARMGEILRETDSARLMQLMELQMRDMTRLTDANLNGVVCHTISGGKSGMGGMGMSGRQGMGPRSGMGDGEHCAHASGAVSCPEHDAMQERLKAVEQRLDKLERAAKSATKPTAK